MVSLAARSALSDIAVPGHYGRADATGLVIEERTDFAFASVTAKRGKHFALINAINTAFGVAAVRKEWLNVARTLEVGPWRRAFTVILPAAAPTILTGMRISVGIAWLVIVAAEMLVGGTGIGYFVWNEWNNLSLSNVIFAILVIGVVGMILDLAFGALQRAAAYAE